MKIPASPLIETPRLTMRLVEKTDLPAIMSVNGDPEVMRYTPHPGWKSLEDGEAWWGRALAVREAGEGLQLVIVRREDGRVIGTMVLFHFHEPTGKAEIGYALAKDCWGQGYAKEAVRAAVEFAFEECGALRLEAQIDPRNGASARVLEAAGFAHEGHQRRNFFAKGEISDTGLYGLLREDRRPGKG